MYLSYCMTHTYYMKHVYYTWREDSFLLFVRIHLSSRWIFSYEKVYQNDIRIFNIILIHFFMPKFTNKCTLTRTDSEIHHRIQAPRTELGRFIASSAKPCSSTELKYVKTSNKSPLEILVNELLLYELRFTINHSQLLFNGRTHFNKTIIEKTSNDPKIIATARFLDAFRTGLLKSHPKSD